MRKNIRNIFLVVLLLITGAVSCAFAESSGEIDYSEPSSWAYFAEGNDRPADLFLICPTVDMGSEGNLNMDIANEELRASFTGALNMERGIYEEVTVMYAPFYWQMTFPVYEKMIAEEGRHLEIAYSDVEDAFLYYINNLNDGRPFILAGFSQGAQLALMLLEEYFDDEALQDRLIAAYCIGWKVSKEDLKKYPHLKMAEGEDDTGVIISFNTEAENIEASIIVPRGVRTLSINPLNWKTDSTYADRSLNKGACFTDYSGSVTSEIPYLTGAYIDPERGTLRVMDVNPSDYSSPLFPDEVYHLYDYQFFFRNLQENVTIRTASWIEQHESLSLGNAS